jgi:hypothetical protein
VAIGREVRVVGVRHKHAGRQLAEPASTAAARPGPTPGCGPAPSRRRGRRRSGRRRRRWRGSRGEGRGQRRCGARAPKEDIQRLRSRCGGSLGRSLRSSTTRTGGAGTLRQRVVRNERHRQRIRRGGAPRRGRRVRQLHGSRPHRWNGKKRFARMLASQARTLRGGRGITPTRCARSWGAACACRRAPAPGWGAGRGIVRRGPHRWCCMDSSSDGRGRGGGTRRRIEHAVARARGQRRRRRGRVTPPVAGRHPALWGTATGRA